MREREGGGEKNDKERKAKRRMERAGDKSVRSFDRKELLLTGGKQRRTDRDKIDRQINLGR